MEKPQVATGLTESGKMYPYWYKFFWGHAHTHPSNYQNEGISAKEIVKIKARVDTWAGNRIKLLSATC